MGVQGVEFRGRAARVRVMFLPRAPMAIDCHSVRA